MRRSNEAKLFALQRQRVAVVRRLAIGHVVIMEFSPQQCRQSIHKTHSTSKVYREEEEENRDEIDQ